jgi:hypothetical protein
MQVQNKIHKNILAAECEEADLAVDTKIKLQSVAKAPVSQVVL